MDADRFDTFARSLTDRRSRRGALAAALAGGLGLAGLAETEGRKKKPCPPCKRRKKGKCKPKPNGTSCGTGLCNAGTCEACAAGQRVCGAACVDLATNPAHCGSCGNTCGATQLCERGTCVTGIGTCAAGANLCIDVAAPCNGNPDCYCIPTQAGATRCARTPPSLFEPCAADGDCAEFGAGAFCSPMVGSCSLRFCLIPC